MTTAAQIVAEARAADEENTGIVTLLDGNPDLVQLIAVWRNVVPSVDPSPEEEVPAGLPPALRLRWVWSKLEPDPVRTWIETAGLPVAPHTLRTVRLAFDNRIVFPDGTLSTWADIYLQQRARAAMGIRRVEAAASPASPPSEPEPERRRRRVVRFYGEDPEAGRL